MVLPPPLPPSYLLVGPRLPSPLSHPLLLQLHPHPSLSISGLDAWCGSSVTTGSSENTARFKREGVCIGNSDINNFMIANVNKSWEREFLKKYIFILTTSIRADKFVPTSCPFLELSGLVNAGDCTLIVKGLRGSHSTTIPFFLSLQ